MCGACRVAVEDKMRFVCVDGPEFDGHKVDFKELMDRLCIYVVDEQISVDHYCSVARQVGR
jgi:ferredoxin--NADP+ reductase